MIVSQAIDIIQKRLGSTRADESRVMTELLAAQEEFEGAEELPWFLLARDTALTTISGDQSLSLPNGFIRVYHEGGLWITSDSIQYPVRKDDLENLKYQQKEGFIDTSGRPKYYDYLGLNAYLFPTPDAAYSCELFFYQKDSKLDLNDLEENAWMRYASDLMISKAGREVARFVRDKEAVKLFTEDIANATLRLTRQNVARREEGASWVVGG